MTPPVTEILPLLARTLKNSSSAVLCAPPGAGKTTLVPQFLLKELNLRKLVMLEPRRVAARAAAARISHLLGEPVGGICGYRTRLDSKISEQTRIEVVTEGILTRMIQDDPELSGYDLVLFDEFHERSVHADLALALCLDSREALREDLKLLVMSATLDAARISELLGNAPVVESRGKMFPVETIHLPKRGGNVSLEHEIMRGVELCSASAEGDVLAFLPGEAEIKRACALISRNLLPERAVAVPLYGNLPPEEQDAALRPDPRGRRKIILATSIAETSLTIDGVTAVIDSGVMRVPRFSIRNGMTRLETVPVSLASADQRRGRAGRTAPGRCIRLWSEEEEKRLPAHGTPEILECDLVPLILELANWGVPFSRMNSLKWLDLPSEAKIGTAAELLRFLGAVDEQGGITPHGREIRRLPLHPRLAHAVLNAAKQGAGVTACRIAALLSERDVSPGIDIRRKSVPEYAVRQIMWISGIRSGEREELSGVISAWAYPDRIGVSRETESGVFQLSNGTGAKLRSSDALIHETLLACAQVEGESDRQRIDAAAPLTFVQVEKYLPFLLSETDRVEWNPQKGAVAAEHLVLIGKAVYARKNVSGNPPENLILSAFLTGIRSTGFHVFHPGKEEWSLMHRVNFIREHLPESDFPDFSEEGLLKSMETWLAPFVLGFTRLEQLKKLNLREALLAALDYRQKMELERLAPERISVPSGSMIRVDYDTQDGIPLLPVKLQEIFGLLKTPSVLNGKVPVCMVILSPAMRPVQITRDLEGFWKESYFLVRKDMRGRYPKHNWPENPLEAVASRKTTKPR